MPLNEAMLSGAGAGAGAGAGVGGAAAGVAVDAVVEPEHQAGRAAGIRRQEPGHTRSLRSRRCPH